MKRTLAIVLLLLCEVVSFAQVSSCLPDVSRSTKSYLIADHTPNDTAFLKEKCRQAGLDLGLIVVANRIPTDSRLVGPRPSEHLLKQGALHLQLPINENQTEFAVYHSELFSQPSIINVLQIDDELIVYRTTEKTGNIHLFYNCTRGAFGTKAMAHGKNATVYKLWDTPERTLLPDLELQDQMAQATAKKLAKTDYPLLIFNDLKSYGYNEQGDWAIGHFLDTMHKYNPDKLLQADQLTPISRYYLSRINENRLWNESMRTKMTETLTDMQEFYRKNQMPWMIGNFQIHLADKKRKATTMEELEWFLSKAAAFDAGFGLDFGVETMRRHGLTDEMLNTINHWETLRLANAFTDEQKETFKDPYNDWHIEKVNDSVYQLYPLHISRRYRCRSESNGWEWNNPYLSRCAIRISVSGAGSISEPDFKTADCHLHFPCTIHAGQFLLYQFDGTAYISDQNYNLIEAVEPQGEIIIEPGITTIDFTCETKAEGEKHPETSVRYITEGEYKQLIINKIKETPKELD